MLLSLLLASAVDAESGYDLWLRYAPPPEPVAESYREAISAIYVETSGEEPSPTQRVISAELERGLGELLDREHPTTPSLDRDGTVMVLSRPDSPTLQNLGWKDEVAELGDEGFVIRRVTLSDRRAIVIASSGEIGALYGTFRFLRHLQLGLPLDGMDIADRPRVERRLLNHWDNLDGTIERGYAGKSLWNWDELPERVDPRLLDYARACASLGLNGTVLNNVNASPHILDSAYLKKVAAIADALRPYGIRVYLSVNFASPKLLDPIPTADTQEAKVVVWWRFKAKEIYDLIPDFGGFLVKANSEGQPGPQDYQRGHDDGANLLAAALRPHGGVVFWRAFVYDADVDPDRIKRSYLEFVPLDGRFESNVFLQAKNGPLDFQPREPFHPLFGVMRRTPMAAELQITQEYLGQSTHLVYLGPMWTEFLGAEYGEDGTAIRQVVDGSTFGYRDTAMAGVANTGSDTNWTGHPFAQANWYAFGRLAWDPSLSAEQIADEWIRLTWSHDPEVVTAIRDLMMDSRETYVRYTMPLGLHHLIGGDHYAPMPENPDPRRADWSAIYYHRADAQGLGVDRSTRPTGTGALAQYGEALRKLWGDPATCPDELLLWFHRLPWNFEMKSGRTLWQELVVTYERGAQEASKFPARWQQLEGRVDAERYAEVLGLLQTQAAEAAQWSEHCVDYFRSRKESD